MIRLGGAIGAAAIALLCPAGAASAATTADTVAIDISATVMERCGLSAGSNPTFAQGRLDRSETLTFNFDIDCNTRFRIGVSSGQGAMRLISEGAGTNRRAADGFAIEKGYRVGLTVDTDAQLLDGGFCNSRDLTTREGDCGFYGDRAGRGLSSQQATAINKTGTLTVQWSAGDEEGARHAAGVYRDTITVVVGPRI